MKKYNLYLWLIALVGLMTSCSQDEADALQTTTESNRVTLTASLPDDFAQPGTRALPTADGHKLRCILEVWTKDASPVLKQRIEKTDLSGDNVVFDFTLDQGSYDCLFWADFIATDAAEHTDAQIGSVTYKHYADKYYTTNDATNGLKAVVINTSNYAFNTDARDAFFGVYPLTKGAAAIENPTIDALTRPFAKLTIKEKNATNYGYCTGLTAKYKIHTTFNVLEESVDYASEVEVTCSGLSSEQQTLFSDYIFTNATSILGAIKLTFTGTDKELLPVTIPDGIPLKRNYKTNASGNLISEKPAPTNGVQLTVTMNTNWSSPGDDVDLDAKVGDYFYSDGTWSTYLKSGKTCIGVIFQVNADGRSGKIVSLDESKLKWCTFATVLFGAASTTDGTANITAIRNWIASGANTNSNTIDKFPAFKWCADKNNGGRTWYLPAENELSDLFTKVSTINPVLETIAGAATLTAYGYWTSTEVDDSNARYIFTNDGSMYQTMKSSDSPYARAISAF